MSFLLLHRPKEAKRYRNNQILILPCFFAIVAGPWMAVVLGFDLAGCKISHIKISHLISNCPRTWQPKPRPFWKIRSFGY
jgi:hypothetical protein